MNNTMKKLQEKQIQKLTEGKELPAFSVGDTVKVNVKIREGSRERVQAYEGVCIARHGSEGDMDASFTVRKISLGEGVERVFPLYSPRIESVELIRRGNVRRAKLYYLRDRRGKSARISERVFGHGLETNEDEATKDLTQTAKRAAKKADKNAKREEARKTQEKIRADKVAAKQAEIDAAAAEAAAAAAPAEEAPAENNAE